jgi:hypothetical protein
VQFTLLDSDTPEGVEEMFSEPFVAHFSRVGEAERFTVTLPGTVLEKLMSSQNAEPGSFSEFVWTFDGVTGEVVSAAVSGTLNQSVNFGFFDAHVDANIDIRLSTLTAAGRGKPRNLMGHTLSKFCTDAADEDCQLFEPMDYDAETGLVQAVGSLSAKTSFITTRTLAPFGKAIFSEVPADLVSAAESASLPSVAARELP